jgi:membrane protein
MNKGNVLCNHLSSSKVRISKTEKSFEMIREKLHSLRPQVSLKKFLLDLKEEVKNDNLTNGAAALGYYLLLAIFPAMISLLTVIPYLPIPNLQGEIMKLLQQAMPQEAASLLSGIVTEVTSTRRGGLLSFGVIATLWAASNGLYAIMQQLNITYDIKETRSFIKVRGTAILLTLLFGVLMISSFALIVLGQQIQSLMENRIGAGIITRFIFNIIRFGIASSAILGSFALIYYFGPNVKQKFRFITVGSLTGAALLFITSIGFRFYVSNFGNYTATYGSIGAVIILMLWLYVTGLAILLGSEINSLIEHYSPQSSSGKNQIERQSDSIKAA